MLQATQLSSSIPNRFEQRDTFRVSNPVLHVEIDGEIHLTENWSLNGLLLKGMIERVTLDQPITGIFGPEGSSEMCQFTGRVIRIDRDANQVAIELDGSSREVAALLPLWVLKYGCV